MTASRFCLAIACMMLHAAPILAGCTIARFASLPVTLEDGRPMTDARIDGRPVRFLIDSGAFFSVISPGSARALELRTEPVPGWIMRGINGDSAMALTTVRRFAIAGTELSRVQFVVAGSTVPGVGVLGQNLLGLHDVEYDLPHGVVRLMHPAGCGRTVMAYWAQGRKYAVVRLEPQDVGHPQTVGIVYLNGVRIRATFDTGSSWSVLSMAAAARAGITPASPGIEPGGAMTGFGNRLVQTWIAPFASLRIGDGEEIRNGRIRFGKIEGGADMLLGADFLASHRVYVAHAQRKAYITYEGGPVLAGGAPNGRQQRAASQ